MSLRMIRAIRSGHVLVGLQDGSDNVIEVACDNIETLADDPGAIIRVGNIIGVAGTTAANPDGSVIAPGDMYGQAKAWLAIILASLEALGATPADVVRTRVFLKEISGWQDAGRAHAEVFADVKSASTFVQVTGFLDPEFLLEVEATAILE